MLSSLFLYKYMFSFASENFQVMNYGIGGQISLHGDNPGLPKLESALIGGKIVLFFLGGRGDIGIIPAHWIASPLMWFKIHSCIKNRDYIFFRWWGGIFLFFCAVRGVSPPNKITETTTEPVSIFLEESRAPKASDGRTNIVLFRIINFRVKS